jgi:hypothetical protein
MRLKCCINRSRLYAYLGAPHGAPFAFSDKTLNSRKGKCEVRVSFCKRRGLAKILHFPSALPLQDCISI